MLIKKIKNNTGSSIVYLGQEIAPTAYYEIQPFEEILWMNNVDLQTDISSGDAIVNNGTTDLNAADGLLYLQYSNTDCIKNVGVDDTDIADGKTLVYKSASGNLEYSTVGAGNTDGGTPTSNYGGIEVLDGGTP